jgi:folate-binding protein YgfZ
MGGEMTIHAALTSRALLALRGPDWRTFLQGLLTNDVDALAPGEARFCGLLTPQGRLLHDLFVIGIGDGVLLDAEAEHLGALTQRLKLYRLRAKVEIETDDRAVGAWLGADAPVGEGVAVPDPRLAALGWRTYGAAPPDAEAAYDERRLALGVPGPADWGSDRTYPIEANFDLLAGIDFKKGCFVGQETTSRMKRRGAIRNRMLPVTFEGPPPAYGSEVLAGSLRAGQILSSGQGRAMALLRLDRIEDVALSVDGRPVTVEYPAWLAQ